MPKNNKEIEKRLTSLEVLMTDTREDIKSIKDNHLTKIYQKLETIEKELWKRPGWITAGLCSIVTALIVYLVTK